SGWAVGRPWSATVGCRDSQGRLLDLTVHGQPLPGFGEDPLWIVTAVTHAVSVPSAPSAAPSAVPAASDTSAASATSDTSAGPATPLPSFPPEQPDAPETTPPPSTALLKAWALAQLPIPLEVCDAQGRVVGVNNAFADIAAMPEDRLIGLGMGEREPGRTFDGLEALPELVEKGLRTGETTRHETTARCPGESHERRRSALLYPVRDPGGEVRGISVVLNDTTEAYWAHRRLSIVNEATLRIGTTLDLTRTADELAEVGTDHFADFVVVDLLDAVMSAEETEPEPTAGLAVCRRAAQRSVLPGLPEALMPIGARHSYDADSPAGQTLVSGEASQHAVDDSTLARWAKTSPERARSIKYFGVHSIMVVPLRARGVTLGLAIFCRHRTPEPFDRDDLLLAEELAARAAVCADNARRYARERATAITLQRSLLPRHTLDHTAVEVASRYMPAGSRAGVGGDWYDVIPLSGARVALVVGDVVGHGLRAAATMGRLRTAVRTLADVDLPPDELLTQLDDVVIGYGYDEGDEAGESASGGDDAEPRSRTTGEMSATCLYVEYDPVSRRCSLASAGHPLPAVVTPDGTVDFPGPSVGPPLGLGGFPFEMTAFELPEGSLLALYTDGLIKAADGDMDTGYARLRDILGQPPRPLEEIGDLLWDAMLSGRAADDIALLLARTRALDADQVATWDLPGDPAVVSTARRLAAERLTAWGLDDAVFTTELVVSELVTNAIRYGAPPIRLRLIRDRTLICQVSDGSDTSPHLRRARGLDEGGRGLMLVARLTDRWGTRHTSTGKAIWAEQELGPD
ncbi:SpoIIE family protein phosphatase, partial [Streptomyces sp. NPDC055078]